MQQNQQSQPLSSTHSRYTVEYQQMRFCNRLFFFSTDLHWFVCCHSSQQQWLCFNLWVWDWLARIQNKNRTLEPWNLEHLLLLVRKTGLLGFSLHCDKLCYEESLSVCTAGLFALVLPFGNFTTVLCEGVWKDVLWHQTFSDVHGGVWGVGSGRVLEAVPGCRTVPGFCRGWWGRGWGVRAYKGEMKAVGWLSGCVPKSHWIRCLKAFLGLFWVMVMTISL